MSLGILGQKLGMTRVFNEAGQSVPVTVIAAGPCPVVDVRTPEKNGYSAVLLGFGERKPHKVTKPMKGTFERAGVSPCRWLREFRIENAADRDEASATEALMACELGASVVRMHNVATTAAMLEHLRPYCVLALGANVALVGTDEEIQEALIAQLNQAIADLCLLPDSQLIDVSSFYESEPAYVEDQEKFVNAVVLLRTSLAPRDMLRYIHAIEDRLGRVRTLRNGPRTCDIDILDYQLYVSNDEELTLPHPRILERDFVVKPLLEILPGHVLSDGTLVTPDQVSLGWAKQITREKL